LEKINIVGRLNLNNTNFKIPIIAKKGYSNIFMSEPWMVELLKVVLPIKKGLFIDVGANLGQTLLKLKCVDPTIRYIGFEPNPNCNFYLQKLISANEFSNVKLIPVGISTKDELGKLVFYSDSQTDSCASIIDEFRPGEKVFRTEYVPIFKIDSLIEKIELDGLSVLKIDVEGAELEVLKSFKEVISKEQPVILIEILPVYSSDNIKRSKRQEEIENLINELGYSIYRVSKEEGEFLGLEKIDAIGIHADLNKCEYVFAPNNVNLQEIQVNKAT